ncbi:MAG: hypothetical protein L6Q37_00180 [Bdellovibrionaceae bacterium]|nr:hypothetical protein [Pseudobdellovibrionaceae bacterium]NUM57536.1 hypothetical protein [Pseudobdellovibrionaceae bacterium]
MKKKKIIFEIVAILTLAIGIWYFQVTQKNQNVEKNSVISKNNESRNLNPLVAEDQGLNKANINIPSGEIVEAIKSNNIPLVESKLKNIQLKANELEGYLSQVIFCLDSKLIDSKKGGFLLAPLLEQLNQNKDLSPRGKILLSKIIGKLELDVKQKKVVRETYGNLKLYEKSLWLDTSIEWVPMMGETEKTLKSYVKPKRSDLISDYFYYLQKTKDTNAKIRLIDYVKKNSKILEVSQQQYVKSQLSGLKGRK